MYSCSCSAVTLGVMEIVLKEVIQMCRCLVCTTQLLLVIKLMPLMVHRLQRQYSQVGSLLVLSVYFLFFFCNTNMKNIVLKGMVSLVNAARVAAGKGGLGWLNPTLYKYSNQFAYDVTCGNNKCGLLGSPCCATGFTATTGWDPVSGLGSVNFTSFKALLAGLGNHLNIPSAAPVIPPAPPITHKPSVTAAPTVSNTGWAYQYTYAGRSCSDSVISVTANPVGVCLQHYILSAKTSYIPLGYKMYSCNNGN